MKYDLIDILLFIFEKKKVVIREDYDGKKIKYNLTDTEYRYNKNTQPIMWQYSTIHTLTIIDILSCLIIVILIIFFVGIIPISFLFIN